MADRILKYTLPRGRTDLLPVEMPVDSVVLAIQAQDGVPVIWARGDLQSPKHRRLFTMVYTGEELNFEPGTSRYVGTVQLHSGDLVLHLFERFGISVPK